MVRVIRSAIISNGKVPEAIAWAKEVSALVEKLGVPKVKVFVDVGGAVGTIRWMADYESLDHLDKTNVKLMSDPGYFGFLKKAADAGLYIDGQVVDIIASELP